MPGGKAEKITKKRNIEDLPDRKAKKIFTRRTNSEDLPENGEDCQEK